jgi:hypothetical protein
MDLDSILKEIEKLSSDKQKELYLILINRLKKKEQAIKSLDEIRGLGKGIWDTDAQDYINMLREDDRN